MSMTARNRSANAHNAVHVVEILRKYKQSSGQMVNLDKSAICFSRNATEKEKIEIFSLLGQQQRNEMSIYLGLPVIVGRSKKKMLKFIKDRVKTKIKGWKGKFLSRAGKEVMLKFVLAAIPTYALSCFQLPDGSWIWRSIFWGRDLLVTGLRWRISDGKNINVWIDPWIPRKNGFTPKNIQMQNNLDFKVADLIDEDTHTWKLHKISTTFEPEDVDAILSIPISIIAKRLQNLDKTCKICGLESEDIEHMLFRCPRSQFVWKQSPINWPDIDNITDFSMWWYNLFLNAKHFPESTELLDLSVNLMWQIWKGRNAWCFNQEMLEPTEIVSKALFEYEEYKDLFTSCLAARHSTGNEFLPKPTNFHDDVLLFTDARLRYDDQHASIGVAALNSLGKLLHAHGSSIQYVGKIMTAKAIAIRKALECAITLGWKSVKIISDAKNVVDMIQKQVATSWEIEVLCETIWKLSSMLDHVEFLYIPRKLNKAAHSLAKFSISLLKDISWEKFFPT
ncbi:uncharacterized protein [Nicotiana sylvestris]|uniref:uncharacterized protein n=1 Tax=Nicotiana sylvestris TaxID=4096 RepID=UPI00388CEBBC